MRKHLAPQGARAGVAEAIADEARLAAATGLHGRYPAGPLRAEDTAGPSYAVRLMNREALGPRLSAAPGACATAGVPASARCGALPGLQVLRLDAGWSSIGIVALTQARWPSSRSVSASSRGPCACWRAIPSLPSTERLMATEIDPELSGQRAPFAASTAERSSNGCPGSELLPEAELTETATSRALVDARRAKPAIRN